MCNRLKKIFTRKGDDGSTDTGNHERVPKYDQQIEVFGSLDELNASIGILTTEKDLPAKIAAFLSEVQQNIFNLSGEIAAPEFSYIDAKHVLALENVINDLNATLPPLKDFVIPGETRAAAHCHQARAICRRVERQLCKLADEKEINPESLKYINRLSDALFVVARVLARQENEEEIIWDHDRV